MYHVMCTYLCDAKRNRETKKIKIVSFLVSILKWNNIEQSEQEVIFYSKENFASLFSITL